MYMPTHIIETKHTLSKQNTKTMANIHTKPKRIRDSFLFNLANL